MRYFSVLFIVYPDSFPNEQLEHLRSIFSGSSFRKFLWIYSLTESSWGSFSVRADWVSVKISEFSESILRKEIIFYHRTFFKWKLRFFYQPHKRYWWWKQKFTWRFMKMGIKERNKICTFQLESSYSSICKIIFPSWNSKLISFLSFSWIRFHFIASQFIPRITL